MALPKLNETPKYELKIPSTGKKVKFRPYLVKEEKILLMAAESGDQNQIMNAIMDTVDACIPGEVCSNLSTFDIEYIFVQLRAKSVGEISKIGYKCVECGTQNECDLNLEKVVCKVPKKSNIIKISDDISVEMRYPSYGGISFSNDETEMGFEVLSSCIEAVLTQEERIVVADEPKESVRDFLESMSKQQFEAISEFLIDMPQVKYDLKFDCENCSHHNEVEITGIQNFF